MTPQYPRTNTSPSSKAAQTTVGTRQTACHFETADGSFKRASPVPESKWDPDGKFSWNPSSVDTNKQCQYRDYVSLLLAGKARGYPSSHVSLLLIGDSLDRHIVRNFCQHGKADGFKMLPALWEREPKAPSEFMNRAETRSNDHTAAADICTNGLFTLSFFKIFGITRTGCTNGGWLYKEDTRKPQDAFGRIKTLMPRDLPASLVGRYAAILVSSNLWDLSDGCLEKTDLDVTPAYAEAYESGIRDVHTLLSEQFPEAKLFWKTSPPMSTSYSKQHGGQHDSVGTGRTLLARNTQGQMSLNKIMRNTVPKLGGKNIVVDWWNMMMNWGRRNIDTDLQKDGRHYSTGPGLAFLNLWCNTIFDRYPTLTPFVRQMPDPVIEISLKSLRI